jgi:hypothetical protein
MSMNDENESGLSTVQRYVSEWTKSRDWIKRYTADFRELETLVDAISLTSTPKAPLVGDITLAAAVRQIPRQSVQQLPVMSFEVNGSKRSIKAILMSWVIRRIVFNQDSFGTGVLSRVQLAAESAFTHGFQMTMASFGTNPHDYGVNLQLVHHADFAVERGILDFSDSGFYTIRSRVTRSRVKAILKKAKANANDTTWKIKELEDLIKTGPNSNAGYATEVSELRSDQALNDADDTYEWLTRYSVGPYYTVDVFEAHTGKHLREAKSNSKFGYPRMQGLVIDPAQLTPFGVSRVRLASAPANYANIYQQSTARMLLINADPPTFERGEFIGTPAMKRRARIRSNDPNAEFKVMEMSNSTLSQYQQVLKHTSDQVLNVMGVTSGSVGVSGGGGGAYENKVKTGMEKNVSDLSTAQVTQIVENHLRQFALTAADLWVSEQARADEEVEVIIDDEAKDNINELGESTFVPEPVLDAMGQPAVDPMTGQPQMTKYEPMVGDDNILMINWKQFYDSIKTWTADIDLSMGKDQMDEKKRADLQDIHTVISQTANPNDPNDMAMKASLTKELLQTALPDTANIANNKALTMQNATPSPEPTQPAQPQGPPQSV